MARLGEILAKNMKEKRRICGLTQAGLAEKVNVSTHHIGMIEMTRNYPTMDLVERMAKALGIEIYELFMDSQSPANDFERMRQVIKEDMRQLLDEFIEKTVEGLCRDKTFSRKDP